MPAILPALAGAQAEPGAVVTATPSGGRLTPERAAFQVVSYDLRIEVDPDRRFVQGSSILTARLRKPLQNLVLDLDSPLQVHRVSFSGADDLLPFERSETQISIELPPGMEAGHELRIGIDYSGHPREAARPPWIGGFVWSQTRSGRPWIAVACQVDGADLWWPNLDHPLGEPQQVDLRVTVPETLVVASNGTLQSVSEPREGFKTYHWHSSNPINPYNVTLNIAPYKTIAGAYTSITGERVPVTLWVLPENLEKGRKLFEQIPRQLRFLEEKLGPYPFRTEKYGVAEVPYLGMEHQTIIAYGGQYRNNEYGFDWLHFHELAHEWWGNMVTAPDWNDYWLHEGFASYMEALYVEALEGPGAMREVMEGFRRRLRNVQPLAPRESRNSVQKYFLPPDFTDSDDDVNFKGAWVLHTLRYLLGDQAFFETLRRFAYPTQELEQASDGRQYRFATTEDFRATAERISGRDLSWFFEAYLRQPRLPELQVEKVGRELRLRWAGLDGIPFPMPVEIQIGNQRRRVDMPQNAGSITGVDAEKALIDPDQWLLVAEN